MNRPYPTKQLIVELCGSSLGLLSSCQHGLREAPALSEFYPHLNLDELVAFAAGSWESRQQHEPWLEQALDKGNTYDLFSVVYKTRMRWLNYYKAITSELRDLHGKLNPYKGNLEARFSRVSDEAQHALREQLEAPVRLHVFECDYGTAKAMHGGENYDIEIMRFQPAYPRKGKVVPAYAAEVARVITSFPSEYDLEIPAVEPSVPFDKWIATL